jgi:hypothetical protein
MSVLPVHELGHVHTFVVNVVSTVQSVLYLTILFCVVHHILVNHHNITTFQSACSKIQLNEAFGAKKDVNAVSTVKSSLKTTNLVDVHQLKVLFQENHINTLLFAYRINTIAILLIPVQVLPLTKVISVAFNFTKFIATSLQYLVKNQALYI